MATNVELNQLVDYWQDGASQTMPNYSELTSTGFAQSGDPVSGIMATRPGAAWFNLIAAMRVSVIRAAGLTPSETPDPLQFLTALQSMSWMQNGKILTDMLANASVTNEKIAENAVKSGQIASGAVGASQLAANAVEASKIKDGEVGTSKLAANAVSTEKLAAGSVTEAKISNAAITSSKIAEGAVGANAIAAGAVGNSALADGAVNAAKIVDGSVGTAELANSAVATEKIGNGAVTFAKIAGAAVATEAEAKAGTATDKVMTPQRTKQAIEALSPACPTGMIAWFGLGAIPEGWLLCNGAKVSRTTYAALFSAIGTRFGAGDGSTTFTLPDLNNRFIEGTTDVSKVGQYLEAGLPNITGEIVGRRYFCIDCSGAFNNISTTTEQQNAMQFSDSKGTNRVPFYASRSSSIYREGSTVQPPALRLLPCIKI